MDHPLEISNQLEYTDEVIYALIKKVREGDTDAREEIILGYTRLVMAKVSTWVTLFPQVSHLSDDMVSEGLLAVIQAVDELIKTGDLEKGSLVAYIHTSIINNINRLLDEENTIRIPRTADNGPVVGPLLNHPTLDNEYILFDFLEGLESLCLTDTEKRILHLRIKGFSDPEISKLLGISRSSIQVFRALLARRYYET